jgi:type IV secretion system protein VirB9
MNRLPLIVPLSIVLTACAGKTVPPSIQYDAPAYGEAVRQSEPAKPVRIIEIPKPLPLPGQLLPIPDPDPMPDTNSPTERVEAGNSKALKEPSSRNYLNAVQVYPWAEGAVYRLYAAPERVTDIALQPGETLIAAAAGDTVRWVVGDTVSGAGTAKRTHVLVKPTEAGLATNLVMTTDRRVYHLAMVSTERTAMQALSWNYPQDELLALRQRNAEAEVTAPVTEGIAVEQLRFRYTISGDNPPWRPMRAFDDGKQVFIAFPERLDQGEAPPLFVISDNGESQLVNYRVRGNYYVVDRLFAAAELRLGEKPQQVVRIMRNDADAHVRTGGRGR